MNNVHGSKEIMAITAQDVIKNRQTELVNEVHQIDEMERELLKQLEALRHKRQLRMFEYDMMDRFDERNMVRITSTTTTVEIGRHNPSDKVGFEDTLKLIYNNSGRPLQMCQLINELEKYGYRWSKYVSAYGYITTCGLVEKVSRGFYQLIRSR